MPTKTAWRCTTCDSTMHDEPEHVSMYLCGECGTAFSRNATGSSRCETCHKFSAKVADTCCSNCEANEEEIEVIELLLCPYCGADDSDNGYDEDGEGALRTHLIAMHVADMADAVLQRVTQ